MKNLFALSVIACALTTFADSTAQKPDFAAIQAKAIAAANETLPQTNRLTRAQIEQRPAVLKKTGGFIDVPSTGTSVMVIECRPKFGGASAQFAEVFGKLSKTNIREARMVLKAGESAFAASLRARNNAKAVFVLCIYEDETAPGLTIYPEYRIALINATKYYDSLDTLNLEIRIVKELWRSLGFVSGIGYAPFKNDVLQPIFSLRDLDGTEYQVMQPINFQKMYPILAEFGVKRARHIPYRTAVIEGWAPAPTNDYQRAVVEELRSEKGRGPTSPVRIPRPSEKK